MERDDQGADPGRKPVLSALPERHATVSQRGRKGAVGRKDPPRPGKAGEGVLRVFERRALSQPHLEHQIMNVFDGQEAAKTFRETFSRLRDEVAKVIVGQDETVEGVLV